MEQTIKELQSKLTSLNLTELCCCQNCEQWRIAARGHIGELHCQNAKGHCMCCIGARRSCFACNHWAVPLDDHAAIHYHANVGNIAQQTLKPEEQVEALLEMWTLVDGVSPQKGAN